MTKTVDREGHYVSEFEAREAKFQGEGPSWLFPLRKAAISRFAEIGFPTKRDEEWKYTDSAPIAKLNARLADQPGDLGEFDWTAHLVEGPRAVFIDGHFSEQESDLSGLPEGCTAQPIQQALKSEDTALREVFGRHSPIKDGAFAALNSALFQDGFFLHVGKGVDVADLIQFVFVSSGRDQRAVFPRNVIIAEPESRVQLCEVYVGAGTALTNVVTEVEVGDRARVEHFKLQDECETAYHMAFLRVHQGSDSHFGNHLFSFGSKLMRNEIDARIDGENSHCDLNGLFVADGTRHVDCHTTLHHEIAHCTSWEMYRGILDHHATGNFLGKINVYPDAQKTDAKQSSSNLLLSTDASVNTKPCLEIYADDVRCTHGATVGQLDEEAEFYLRSRGIPQIQARNMLIHAFAEEVVEAIPVESLRNRVITILDSRLPGGESKS